MNNIQVRLPENELDELDELSTILRTSRSEAARAALHEGMVKIRMSLAVRRYLEGEVSMSGAAHLAGVSVQKMAVELSRMGIDVFRYTIEDVERDSRFVEHELVKDRR